MIAKPKLILKEVFGFDSFRGRQEEIIDSIISGSDSLVLMPTGGGKSICYQIPAICLPGFTIVISPLIALMKDQVDALRLNGVQAEFLNSTLSAVEQNEILTRLQAGEVDLLYLAPERINDRFWTFMRDLPVNLFAVDEAHCISHWGHDFRPDYRHLQRIKEYFPDIPLVALTATADQMTRKDIVASLHLSQPRIFISSFNRPNIKYLIEPKKDSFSKLINFLEPQKEESGIIYCLSRKSTERLADDLRDCGFNAIHYHAGMNQDERRRHQELFAKDEVQIVVATIAFGMGIDKSNVRFVVHMDLPKNMESYYQETGRAGRDGLDSTALLFYSYADVIKLKGFVEIEGNEEQSKIMLKKLDQMAQFCSGKSCRRKVLLNYFNEKTSDSCGNCDICLGQFEKIEATEKAQMAFSAIARLDQRFGMGYVIDILKGSESQRIKAHHKELPTFGVGKKYTREEWTTLIKSAIDQEFLSRTDDRYPILKLTSKSWEVLKENRPFTLIKRKSEELPSEPSSTTDEKETFDKQLFHKLRTLRMQIAASEGVAPFMVFSDVTLKELSTYFPAKFEDLERISGFGKYKLTKYGEYFLNEVLDFCAENSIESKMHLHPKYKKKKRKKSDSSKKKGGTFLKTKKLAEGGLSIREIAETRKLAQGTIARHIAFWIEKGELNINQFLSPEKQTKINEILDKDSFGGLREIKQQLDDHFTYDEIRFQIASRASVANGNNEW